jgi:hypothetical protein
MTHAQALADAPGVWPGRDCGGTLEPTHTGHDGPIAITVYACPRCLFTLSIEDASGAVRNCYPPPRPRDLIRELAQAFDVTPRLPKTTEDY